MPKRLTIVVPPSSVLPHEVYFPVVLCYDAPQDGIISRCSHSTETREDPFLPIQPLFRGEFVTTSRELIQVQNDQPMILGFYSYPHTSTVYNRTLVRKVITDRIVFNVC